jgi:hypothetical protein
MHGLELQGAQDEHVERAPQKGGGVCDRVSFGQS